ncbi:hypothetical protein [Bradyrhizobium sp. WSM2254]|uniref:hypothetical protein n=1 Tax=Bradyrhizobium sp. WSM2254 TaxID=1188263 RepID=UPI000402E0D5|nr:hypothetical protein [Bradyrhizobium sp. WSM2254]
MWVADLAEPKVKAMHQAGRVDWDIAYIEAEAYPAMHEVGMFAPIDYSLWNQEALGSSLVTDRRNVSWRSYAASLTSVLRPGTFLA